ncbi:MAG TPA: tetratricopeptide repeat protein [Opitutaceae bacterium]|nr:tetratricopeptide repeat protein [Opitutaceae bacterium]
MSRLRNFGAAALIALVGLAAYLPTLRNGFVWDDDTVLAHNALVRSPDGILRLWTTAQQADYWPVSLASFWAEWRVWGTDAAGYHATNLALHLACCLLLWSVLRRLRIPGAALAALLFAVHPVNVESVAWITQRKNLLGMLFFLLSARLFLPWLERGPGRGARAPYLLSLLAFALAMLSKGSVAPLPLVLLGAIAWRRRPTRSDWLALLPFFLVAAALAAVNVWFESRGFHGALRQAGPAERLLGAGAAVWFYLGKALWPAHLSLVYPQWRIDPGSALWWLPLLAAAGLTAALLAARRRLRPALFAWLYFGVMLAPALGFTDVYFMRFSLVADHYQHLALIGVVALAGWAWAAWRWSAPAKGAVAAAAVLALALLTARRARAYRDEAALYRATLAENPGCWMAYNGLGMLAMKAGQPRDALADLNEALRLNPEFAEAHLNRGALEFSAGRMEAAHADFAQAARFGPLQSAAHLNLAASDVALGRSAEAVPELQEALRLRPDYPEAYYYLGNAYQALNRLPEAAEAFAAELRLRPGDSDVEDYLGTVYAAMGNDELALRHFQRAIALNPDNAAAHHDLADCYRRGGRTEDAERESQAAARALSRP